jgi:hypothetical protein
MARFEREIVPTRGRHQQTERQHLGCGACRRKRGGEGQKRLDHQAGGFTPAAAVVSRTPEPGAEHEQHERRAEQAQALQVALLCRHEQPLGVAAHVDRDDLQFLEERRDADRASIYPATAVHAKVGRVLATVMARCLIGGRAVGSWRRNGPSRRR